MPKSRKMHALQKVICQITSSRQQATRHIGLGDPDRVAADKKQFANYSHKYLLLRAPLMKWHHQKRDRAAPPKKWLTEKQTEINR